MKGQRQQSHSRSPVFFSLGLIAAAGLAIGLDKGALGALRLSDDQSLWTELDVIAVASPRSPSPFDRRAAEIAWSYIEANTRPETGMVDSVAGFASTTLWDQGSYLMGMIAAYRLGVITEDVFHIRTDALLSSFEKIPLFENKLPNKVYNTQTLAMTNYENQAKEDGVGWSALDVARMLAAFRVLERQAPTYGDRVRTLTQRWDLAAMTKNGELVGAAREGQETTYPQEGRIGYEQYGARAAGVWSLDVSRAISAQRILTWTNVSGTKVPIDLRSSSSHGAINPTTSEPYFLQALEFGFDSEGHRLATLVYRAQENRFHETGIVTMVSEDHLDTKPHFLYGSVHSNGHQWAVVNEDGLHFPELRTVSTKAAFSWEALLGTPYATSVRNSLSSLGELGKGWAAGQYELSGSPNAIYTLNTNAIVLEALHFREMGSLWENQG